MGDANARVAGQQGRGLVRLTHSYSVRDSARAKRVRLTMSARDGLVVVVPRGFDRRQIPALVQQHAQWIERATARLLAQAEGAVTGPGVTPALPHRVTLPAIGEEWTVVYRHTPSAHVTCVEKPGNTLLIYGAIRNQADCLAALRRWLNRKAHKHIKPWLLQLAAERGFAVGRVLVKAQRTRWASCSQSRTISLNMKLLFVPPEVVRYTLLHELCHTVQLNHARSFWSLLRRHEPSYVALRQRLRVAWRDVPGWVG